MGKRLKRRVRELCGLEGLSGEERQKRARQILNDNSFKQYLCNQVLGLTFKDIDTTMKAVLADRKPISEYEEEALVPEKFADEPVYNKYNKYSKHVKYRDLTMEEAVALIEASRAPFEQPEQTSSPSNYSTYSPEEVADLIAGTYDPRKYRHLRRRR